MMIDMRFLDIFSRQARDCLGAEQVPFGPCGLFTQEQSSLIFTAVLQIMCLNRALVCADTVVVVPLFYAGGLYVCGGFTTRD